jgi:DtxR family Mn-dependent transcriptional regulator
MSLSLSQSEENYLKSVFNLLDENTSSDINRVSTNLIAKDLQTKASSVTEMVKKLSDKGLLSFEKYKGCNLTKLGNTSAIEVIRKHRLWETFLVEKLSFNWDEVHDIAEQLEHIKSPLLTNKLSAFLNHPKFDPHGDPIPDKDGIFPKHDSIGKLTDLLINQNSIVVKIGSDNTDLLSHLSKNNIGIHTQIKCLEKNDFDDSMKIEIDGKHSINLSKKVVKNIYIKIIK